LSNDIFEILNKGFLMLYSEATLERKVQEGDLLFVAQVKIALKMSGREVDRQTILKWIHQKRLKATKFFKGEDKLKFEWLVDPSDLKNLMKSLHKERPPGGTWFKD
jgi:hypothetical protein